MFIPNLVSCHGLHQWNVLICVIGGVVAGPRSTPLPDQPGSNSIFTMGFERYLQGSVLGHSTGLGFVG